MLWSIAVILFCLGNNEKKKLFSADTLFFPNISDVQLVEFADAKPTDMEN